MINDAKHAQFDLNNTSSVFLFIGNKYGGKWMSSRYISQKTYADTISELRSSGKLEQAIAECIKATKAFPDNNFFYRILGDLYRQNGNMESAFNAYFEQIKLIHGHPELVRTFSRFYAYLKLIDPDKLTTEFMPRVMDSIQKEEISYDIKEALLLSIGEDFLVDKGLMELCAKTNSDENLTEVRKTVDKMAYERNMGSINVIANYRINAVNRHASKKIDSYFLTLLEHTELFDKALLLIEKIMDQSRNPIIIRTLLRICRKKEDYTIAEKLLFFDDNFINRSDFNIQYELVYYYETRQDEHLLKVTLQKMKESASRSLPISRTLYNFYLRFNMFEEAKEMSEHIKLLSNTEKQHRYNVTNSRIDEQFESEQGVWFKLKELVSEQEHNRQMIALSDLLKGFSHELGQPITNIRYAVQLHQMKIQRGATSKIDLENLLALILRQTKRIDDMLARFRPIISNNGRAEWFNVTQRITGIFEDMSSRLNMHCIQYLITGDTSITIFADAVQFDQVFYNLILNSIQALDGYKDSGTIKVDISSKKVKQIYQVEISFFDDGPGIPIEISKQIFEPFYSTKAPISGSGGEGLGLFIVWNILKMLDGSIYVNTSYKKGAKFDITIPVKQTDGGT